MPRTEVAKTQRCGPRRMGIRSTFRCMGFSANVTMHSESNVEMLRKKKKLQNRGFGLTNGS